jgi:hypothetical protein
MASGTAITWENRGISPVMLEGESLQDPAGGGMVRLTGEQHRIAVFDSLGLIDSVVPGALGATVRIPAVAGPVAARIGGTTATAILPPVSGSRSVVVLGMAGWELKFTIQALEERGWKVESRIGLAPRLSTGQGRPFPLDTARHLAVVALDSSAAAYAGEIVRFVRSGGGVILGAAVSPARLRIIPAGVTELEGGTEAAMLSAWRLGSGIDSSLRVSSNRKPNCISSNRARAWRRIAASRRSRLPWSAATTASRSRS